MAAPCPFPLSAGHPGSRGCQGRQGEGGGRKLAVLLSNPEKERERERTRGRERERDGLIWEHRQTICGNGLEGSRGQIPDRWKKLNMGHSRFWAQKTALVSQ